MREEDRRTTVMGMSLGQRPAPAGTPVATPALEVGGRTMREEDRRTTVRGMSLGQRPAPA